MRRATPRAALPPAPRAPTAEGTAGFAEGRPGLADGEADDGIPAAPGFGDRFGLGAPDLDPGPGGALGGAVPGPGRGASAGAAGPALPAAGPAAPIDVEKVHRAVSAARFYPRAAREQGLEGVVLLRVRLDDQGRVLEVELVRSAGPILDDAARGALGRAAPFGTGPGWVQIPVEFSLDAP
jgi:protein TonB